MKVFRSLLHIERLVQGPVYKKPFGYQVIRHGYILMSCQGQFKITINYL